MEKNNKLNKELSTNDEVTLKTKLFTYFYYVLKKKDINILLCTIFLILETIQFISYAFSDPVSFFYFNFKSLKMKAHKTLENQ